VSSNEQVRTYKSGEERRREIIAATLGILAEEGMHAWTTSALAERVGVSEAAIFKHFKDKDEILTAALRHQARELRSRIEEYDGRGSAWERAEGLIGHLLGYLEQTQGGPLVILLGQASRIQPEMKQELGRTRELLQRRLRELAAEALEESGRSREMDAGAVAEMTHAVMLSTALRSMISDEREDLMELASPMLGVMRHCLGADGGGSPQEEDER
jgi:AcrR family transcriptional regulator